MFGHCPKVGLQAVHSAAPVLAEYFPAGHTMQDEEVRAPSWEEKVPTLQSTQSDMEIRPVIGLYFPLGHDKQSFIISGLLEEP